MTKPTAAVDTPSTKNVTVPAGGPKLCAATVAVNVTGSPTFAGFAEEVSVVRVPTGDTTWYAPTSFTFHPRGGEPERWPGERPEREHKGLRYEAAEVARCLRDGLTESPVMPLDETVSIMETMDEVRAQVGLTYPGL